MLKRGEKTDDTLRVLADRIAECARLTGMCEAFSYMATFVATGADTTEIAVRIQWKFN